MPKTIMTVDDSTSVRQMVSFALQSAGYAVLEACDGKDASVVDTYARALFDTGNVDEAIKYQQKAIDMAKHEELRKELQKTLDRYQESRK